MKVKITRDIGLRKAAYEEMLTILKHTVFDDNDYEIVGACNHCGHPSSNDSISHRVPCTKRDVYVKKVYPPIYFRVVYSTNLSWDGSITDPFFRCIYIEKICESNDPTAYAQIAEPSTPIAYQRIYNSIFSDYYWTDTHSHATYGYRYGNGGV